MTTDNLRAALSARADRADRSSEFDATMAALRSRRDHLARRRRNAVAAGGGSLVVAGVVTGTVLIASGSSAPSGGDNVYQAGGGPVSSSATAASSYASPTVSSSRPGGSLLSLAGSAASSESASSGSTSTSLASTPSAPPTVVTPLAHVPAAPKSAPLSISLVPTRWTYLASGPVSVLYGPSGLKDAADPNTFVKRIALLVGEPDSSQGTLSDRVGTYQAKYSDQGGVQVVYVAVSKTRAVTIQVWSNAKLTRAQVFKIANTLDIRDLSHVSRG